MRENAVEIIFVIPLERLQNYGMYITAAVKVARCNLKLWQVLDNIYNKNCERRRQYGERERDREFVHQYIAWSSNVGPGFHAVIKQCSHIVSSI
jgi:hypothetical protein